MKIIDTFLFSNELDMLEIRLNELNPYVDKFLICESKVSFAGNRKEAYFEKNKSRYEKFLHKIIHVVIENLPENILPEHREYFNRNYIAKAIPYDFDGDDIVLFSDVDEIPKMQNLPKKEDVFVFRQDMYYFNFNTKFIAPNDHKNWHGTIGFKAKYKSQVALQDLRFNRYNIQPVIQDGGWHFSYFSNASDIINKITNGGHSELLKLNLNDDLINQRIKDQKDVLGREGYELVRILDNNNLPTFVLNNKEKYKKFFI